MPYILSAGAGPPRRPERAIEPMRILYAHQYFCTPRGHSGTRSYEQAKAMAAAGHRVTLLTSGAQLREDEIPSGSGYVRRGLIDGIDCIVLQVAYHQTMSYSRRVLSFLKFMLGCWWVVLTGPRVDLVYATSTPLTVGAVALAARLLRRTPYAFEVRDLWPDVPLAMGVIKPGLFARLLKFVERRIYRHARLLVAVNEDVGEQMLETAGCAKPLVVAPNACDVKLFRPDRGGEEFRRRHGLEDKVLCVHTGTMGPANGLDSVIDVAAALRDVEPLRFFLIGEGNQKDHLKKRVSDQGLANVTIMDGMPKADLADVLATADIGLVSFEAIPILQLNCANKFFDYLASGLPVVLNYQGWQARILAEHDCGLSAPQGDAAAFAAAIRTLAADPARRAAMGRNARKVAETRLNRTNVVAPILKALETI